MRVSDFILAEKVVRKMGMVKLKYTAVIVLGVSIATGFCFQALAKQSAIQAAPNQAKEANQALARDEAPNAREAEEEKHVSVKEMPPVVVRTVPQAGDTAVDAEKVKEIRVTFSKDMTDESWSWSQISAETFPKVDGKPHYDKDRRTCVLPVKLEPSKTYVLWLNSEKFGNFKDAEGKTAVPYLLVFETKPKE